MDRCVPDVQAILVLTSRGSNQIVRRLQISWEGVRIMIPNTVFSCFSVIGHGGVAGDWWFHLISSLNWVRVRSLSGGKCHERSVW